MKKTDIPRYASPKAKYKLKAQRRRKKGNEGQITKSYNYKTKRIKIDSKPKTFHDDWLNFMKPKYKLPNYFIPTPIDTSFKED